MEPLENRSLLATFTVINTLDSGAGSLRQAILDANNTVNVDSTGDGIADPDLIGFNIPGAGVHTITPAVGSSLPFITDPVTIDGYTQPGASPNTHAMTDPDPSDNAVLLIEIQHPVDLGSNGLVLLDSADGSTIRGLVIDGGFSRGIIVQASAVHIEGCFIGVDPTGTTVHGNGTGISFAFGTDTSNGVVGGTTPDKRNLISGNNPDIFIQSGTKHLIQGNLIGTNATGLVGLSGGDGLIIQGSNDDVIGGSTPAARNVINSSARGVRVDSGTGNRIQGNFIQVLIDGVTPGASANSGIFLDSGSSGTQIGGLTSTPGTGPGNVIAGSTGIGIGNLSTNNVIQGNLIGTDATGTKAVGIAQDGILVTGASNTIGGPSHDARNVISASGRAGISLTTISTGSSHDNLIQNNFIGTDINGNLTLLGNGEGVFLNVSSNNQILNNIIAGNAARGVDVASAVTNTAILGNSIFANGALGIDLRGGTVDPNTGENSEDPNTGVTHNDPGDADSGFFAPNNLQNFPELTSVNSAGGSTTITGTLNSVPSTTFRIEFFANDVADLSSFGEGKTLLGFKNFTTDAGGNAPISATLPVATAPSQFITATATRLDESNLPVETSEFSQLIADLALSMSDAPDPVAALQDLVYTLSLTNGSASSPSGPVTLTDTLPDNVTFISATTSQGTFTPAGNTVTFDLGTLAMGGSVAATITVRPTAAAAGTTLNNSATVTSVVSDPNTANNSDSEATDVTAAAAPQTDLQVTKSASPNAAVAGTDLTYTITVANAGPSDAQSVSLSDVLPTGTTFVSAGQTSGPAFSLTKPPVGGGGTLAASASTLAAGASASFTLVVHINASTPDDTTLNNSATVTSTTPDTNTANNSSTESTGVNTEADLRVTKSAGSSVVTAGGNITYTITLTNLGPSDAQSASISDLLPAGTTFVSFASPGGFTATTPAVNGTGTVTASAAVLAAGQSAAFQLVVGVGSGAAAGTSVTNTALASTATADTNLANNSASATVQVEQPAAASALTITLVSRQAKFRNEFGLFIVDDASGRIGNLLPGAAGYARAALSRAKVVFAANTKLGTSRTVNLPAGSYYGLYLIQNANKAQFLARNPTNRLSGKLPLMFFSFRAANPDGFEHLGQPSPTRFAFEDMTSGGDQDFNDVIVDIRAQTAAAGALQPSARLGRRR